MPAFEKKLAVQPRALATPPRPWPLQARTQRQPPKTGGVLAIGLLEFFVSLTTLILEVNVLIGRRRLQRVSFGGALVQLGIGIIGIVWFLWVLVGSITLFVNQHVH